MCTVQDDGEVFPVKKEPIACKNCMKCSQQKPVVVVRTHDPLCRCCFMSYCIHKFRMSFGKSRLVRDQERVLLAYSGGHGSNAMIHLIQEGKSERTRRKLRFVPTLVYIDEIDLLDLQAGQTNSIKENILSKLQDSNMPYIVVNLAQVFSKSIKSDFQSPQADVSSQIHPSTNVCDSLPCNMNDHDEDNLTVDMDRLSCDTFTDNGKGECSQITENISNTKPNKELSPHTLKLCASTASTNSPGEGDGDLLSSCVANALQRETHVDEEGTCKKKLLSCFNAVKTLTAKEDLLKILRLQLLKRVAELHKVTKILLGESATRIAVTVLSDIAQGRGAHLPYQVRFADTRDEKVFFLKPMREFTSREIALYNNLNRISAVFVPTLSTKASGMDSIGVLAEEFVTGLQAEYPNTVYTICRTGEKLDLSQAVSAATCSLCQVPLDTATTGCSALDCHRWSQDLMSLTPDVKDTPSTDTVQQCCSLGACEQAREFNVQELCQTLCYGCQITVKETDPFLLPQQFIQTSKDQQKTEKRKKLRDSIQEFLLEDD